MTMLPTLDLAAEADEAFVQAVPGAVFLRLRRSEYGTVVRRMFVEMTPDEARGLARELRACVRQAERLAR